MKKIVLLAAAIFAFIAVNSLPVQAFSQNKKALNLISEKIQSSNQVVNDFINPEQSSGNNKTVNVVAIGSSANAFGLSGAARNILWADNQLNTITFIHRMNNPPGSGNIAFSYSVDGGLTWSVNNQILSSQYNARWPQGVIYNQAGDNLYEDAYFTYFSPSTPQGNYVSGTCNLNMPLNPTHNLWEGEITDAIVNFIINPVSGHTFSVAAGTDEFVYSGNLLITKGVFNPSTNDFDYNQSLLQLPIHPQGNQNTPVDIRIAFAPDGLVGYISVLWDNMLDTHAGGQAYYPILFKTTDGGNTWSLPEAIIIGGSEGFSAIKNYLSDYELEDIFGLPIPDRNSLIFTTAYDHGLAVDVNGNPHIGVTVGLIETEPYSIYGGNSGYAATFHFHKSAVTQAYKANLVCRNKTFRGYFGPDFQLTEDNRTQVSSTQDGSKIFVSWLDTDFAGASNNSMPDIFCWGFDAINQSFTHVANITQSSEAGFEAFNGTASHYVFSNQNSYTIPFVYQTITDFDPLSPVDYKYINDFSFTDSDFISGVTVDFIVQDINNVPVAGAVITLEDITNPAGNYVFHNITPGIYNYTIEKYGFITYTGVVNVTDQNETITVTLENSGFAMIIRDVTAIAGDDILVELEINNEETFITFQADILLPDGFGYIEGSAQLNPERTTDHLITAHVLPETNILRCLAFTLTNDSFIGNSGVIASFMLTSPTTPGIYELVLINGGQNGIVTLIAPNTYTVTFIIKDQNQQPIDFAVVTLGTITNPAGNYVFHNITPGVYNYTIEKYGFITYTGVVNVTDQNETITVTLENSGFAMIIRDVTAIAGDDILVELEINNEDSFITFQADILLPDGFGYIEGSAQLNPERMTDQSIIAHVLPETNILRCLAFTLTNDSFIGNSGVIASFMLTTPTTPGIYELVLINGGQNGIVTLIAPDAYTVTFVIHDIDQQPIDDAVVILGNIGNLPGDYVFTDILPGNYSYFIEKDSYISVSGIVELIDSDLTISVTLESGGNVIVLHPVIGEAGQNILIDVEFINEDTTFVAFQFDVNLPDGFEYVPGSIVINPERIPDVQIMASTLPGTNTLRFVAFFITNTGIIGHSGVVFSFILSTPKVPDIYILKIGDAIFGTIEGTNILTDVVDGIVTLLIPTGIPEPENETVRVFPNPATHTLNIMSEKPMERVKLFNFNGQLIFDSRAIDNTSAQIKVNQYPAGIYLLQIINNEGQILNRKITIHSY